MMMRKAEIEIATINHIGMGNHLSDKGTPLVGASHHSN